MQTGGPNLLQQSCAVDYAVLILFSIRIRGSCLGGPCSMGPGVSFKLTTKKPLLLEAPISARRAEHSPFFVRNIKATTSPLPL